MHLPLKASGATGLVVRAHCVSTKKGLSGERWKVNLIINMGPGASRGKIGMKGSLNGELEIITDLNLHTVVLSLEGISLCMARNSVLK